MPSRLLREGILDSSAVNELTFPAEVFYRRLMSVVDDFGRFDGRPAVLRGRLYSLKLDTVREADISRWIAECEKVGLLVLYTVDAKPYILFTKLGPARAKESKFPAPPLHPASGASRHASVNGCKQTKTDANGCVQTQTDAPDSDSDSDSDSDLPPSEVCPEPLRVAAEPTPTELPVLIAPTTGSGAKEWHLTPTKLAEYEQAFPTLDVLAALRAAVQWCRDNSAKRKTAKGMPAFCTNWLNSCVNRRQHLRSPPTLPFTGAPVSGGKRTSADVVAAARAELLNNPKSEAG